MSFVHKLFFLSHEQWKPCSPHSSVLHSVTANWKCHLVWRNSVVVVWGPSFSGSRADGYHEPQQILAVALAQWASGTWLWSQGPTLSVFAGWLEMSGYRVGTRSRRASRMVGWSRFPSFWPESEFNQACVCTICNCQQLVPQPEDWEVDTATPHGEDRCHGRQRAWPLPLIYLWHSVEHQGQMQMNSSREAPSQASWGFQGSLGLPRQQLELPRLLCSP